MAHRNLTGVLLVGGESRRFGSPKALARMGAETLAERAWRVLGQACAERIAVGKRGELELPFDVVDDGTELRTPLAGVVAGLRAATNEVAVFLPVDVPLMTAAIIRTLGAACRDAAMPAASPAPCAIHKRALPLLEHRLNGSDLSLRGALRVLDTVTIQVDPALLADADTPEELGQLRASTRSRSAPVPTSVTGTSSARSTNST